MSGVWLTGEEASALLTHLMGKFAWTPLTREDCLEIVNQKLIVNDCNAPMTGDADFDSMLRECCSILEVKGEDYRIGSVDKLANFSRAAEMFGLTPEQVLGVYLYKHFAAVFNYIKSDGQSESEPIRGRIADVINYMLLLSKMVELKRKKLVEDVPF